MKYDNKWQWDVFVRVVLIAGLIVIGSVVVINLLG